MRNASPAAGAVADAADSSALVGGDLLNLITGGMYAGPLAIYREYVQNAADAIAASDNPDAGEVEINIDLAGRRVTIRDNGPGLSHAQAKRALIPIAKSNKHRGRDRGFRGIGRLSGLAFGTRVTFLTRQKQDAPVTQVAWHGENLRAGIARGESLQAIIAGSVAVSQTRGDDYPPHFFEVHVEGISRHAVSAILNRDAVRRYLAENAPLPFDAAFAFAAQVENLLGGQLFTLAIRVDDEAVTRPHKHGIDNRGAPDAFCEFEKINIPAIADGEPAAVGWIAHSSYLGALRKSHGIRCLRARAGNIQIGDEAVFDHLFFESRFNRWCIGEVHILDPHIVPNGRRDYFEPGPHLRNLENHLGAVCRRLEKRCRTESHHRNQKRRADAFLRNAEATHELAMAGYLTRPAAREICTRKANDIAAFLQKHETTPEQREKLRELQTQLADCKPPPAMCLPGIPPHEVAIYRKIFHALVSTGAPQQAKTAIEEILRHRSA